jgi:hypothetical protein
MRRVLFLVRRGVAGVRHNVPGRRVLSWRTEGKACETMGEWSSLGLATPDVWSGGKSP